MDVARRALIWTAAGALSWWPAGAAAAGATAAGATAPVTVPTVSIPAVTLPLVTVPSISLPPITLPSITLPPATVPSATVPPVTLPPAEPSVSSPATSLPSPSPFPSPATVPHAAIPSPPGRTTGAAPPARHATIHLAVQTARAFGLPFTVAAVVMAFLVVQARIDRSDPKLVDAPVTLDEDMVWFQ